MQIKIKRFDKSLPLPEYKTSGAAAIDCYSRTDTKIPAGQIGYIPLNIATHIPKGYFWLLAARSSTHKMGLMPANGIGIIDSDYCGDNDEILFAAFNFTKKAVAIEKGTRVAQLILVKFAKADIKEVRSLGNKDRGGFGSTGKK